MILTEENLQDLGIPRIPMNPVGSLVNPQKSFTFLDASSRIFDMSSPLLKNP